jgi:hypothetical protein
MKIAALSSFGLPSICFAFLLFSSPAHAQNCYPSHSAGFARLASLEKEANSQASADLAVRGVFGPRNDQCEPGAYSSFMESFREFSRQAMRAKTPASRDKLLRLAIATIAQAPIKVPAQDAKTSASLFRQVRSDLNATADDVGFEKTPLLQQLMDALSRIGPPTAVQPPPVEVSTTSGGITTSTTQGTSIGTASGGVQSIRVPSEPLPPWAIVKLYEMRDHIKAQDLPAIQIKLQDIINWVEAKTAGQQ